MLCYTVKLRPSFKCWCQKLKHEVFALPKKLFCIFQKGGMEMSYQEFITFGRGNSSELVAPPPLIQLTFQHAHFLTVGVTTEKCPD
jgi:hypothetical protein